MINYKSLFKSFIEIVDKEKKETNNCILVAHTLSYILTEVGIKNNVCLGFAVWSVGQDKNDIITHLPNSMTQIGQEGGMVIHAWVEVGEDRKIIDFTTYQLKKKGKLLEVADGLKTNVKWCPDYLVTTQDKLKSLDQIKHSKYAGNYGYQRVPKYEEAMIASDNSFLYNQKVKLAKEIIRLNNEDFIS